MKPLIIILCKILASFIFGVVGCGLVIIAIILWNEKYIEVGDDILHNMIWGK